VAKDHSEYLDEHYEIFLDQPGFPALRTNPVLLSADQALSTSDEQLLLVLHCGSGEIDNENVVLRKGLSG
jgi:hypothetical protein